MEKPLTCHVYVCVCVCVCVAEHQHRHPPCIAPSSSIYSQCYEETYSMKKRLTPLVFVCIYKLLYTYVYPLKPYKYVPKMPGRSPGTWESLGTLGPLEFVKKWR